MRCVVTFFFFFSSRRRHTTSYGDWSSDVCSSDLTGVLTSTGGGTSVRNTLAGDLPFGEVALSAAVEAIKAGQPLKIVCAGAESVADILWIAKPDSPLASIQDIVGKKIGYTSPGSVTNMLILMAMKAQGIDAGKVTLVPAGGI